MGSIFKIRKGEDRILPMRAIKDDGTPYGTPWDLTDADQIAVLLPTQSGFVERLLVNRAEWWVLEIVEAKALTAYAITIGSETATFTSGASTTMATIQAGLVAAINALTGARTASAGGDSDEIYVHADVAGAAGSFVATPGDETLLTARLREAGLDGGDVVVDSAVGGEFHADLPDSVSDDLKVGAAQSFEVVVDKDDERRILVFSQALTVEDRIFGNN